MCGIAGFLDRDPLKPEAATARVVSMAQAIAHRGPDDADAWVDPDAGIALGHRRLSIVDLSELGRQPMHSVDQRLVLIFNGEIYNHNDLRRDLARQGVSFRGHSDTEVLLAALHRWGVAETLPRLIGMFAFALWDRPLRQLTLVRDALGIKPLYYGWIGRCFLFGSELKALRAHPDFVAEVDRAALSSFLYHGYIPSPRTIYTGIETLRPGYWLTVSLKPDAATARPTPWWSMADAAANGLRQPFAGSDDDAIAQLDEKIRDAVRLRMLADVPVGAFLSGGIDSSTVAAMMQTQSIRPIRTFSIGFQESGYDEAPHARAVAQHIGTDHTECYVSSAEARDVIPRLPTLFDEPFGDSSQIPTYLVSQIARRDVTVCLSGDGGDELFCGYERYARARRLWDHVARFPKIVRHVAGETAGSLARWMPPGLRGAARLTLAHAMLTAQDGAELYARFHAHWRDARRMVISGSKPRVTRPCAALQGSDVDLLHQITYIDGQTYLPDDILVKVDRASMAVGLEARVPLLDRRVVEFAWRLPLAMKVRDGQSKWILRRVLDRYVPRALVERPKMGFGVPIDHWLRGPLRDWAEALLDRRRLQDEGFLQPGPIRRKWEEHLAGRADWQYLLWDVLMFQAWHEHWR